MPNKPVNHTNLDNAIKNSLLNNPTETKVNWEDIDSLLPKKTTVKGPLADFSFSLNSFAGVAALGSQAKVKAAMLFAKKWSAALYITAGTIIVGTGTFLIYNSVSQKTSSSTEKLITAPVTQEIIKEEVKPAIPQNTTASEASTTTPETTPETSDEPLITTKASPAGITAGTQVSENPNPAGAPLIKATTQQQKTQVASEPIQLKTEEPAQNEGYDFSTSPAIDNAIKPDMNNETQTQEGKKGKVLYYKESLSLDKLEQQISDEKNQQQINPAAKDSSKTNERRIILRKK